MKGRIFLVAAALALAPGPAAAESGTKVYRYTDEKGVTHYTNVPNDTRFEPEPEERPPLRGSGDEKSRPYEESIVRSAGRHGVDPNLLRAVIKCESNFNQFAISRAGAQGLMQLMPDTAKLVDVDNPFDASDNLDGGTRYLKYLLDSFKDKKLALAAYNAGEGNVRRHGGIPPFKETQNYVKAVLEQYDRYCSLGAESDPITSADIESFVSSDGVRLFTNVPWRYRKKDTWQEVED